MKTMAGFTMALATLVFATAADADVYGCSGGRAGENKIIGVRAGTPCKFIPSGLIISPAIIERPHNVAAVLRADGGIYFYPKPGFTGKDSMTVRYSRVVPMSLRYSREPQFTTEASTWFVEVFWGRFTVTDWHRNHRPPRASPFDGGSICRRGELAHVGERRDHGDHRNRDARPVVDALALVRRRREWRSRIT
jgi:hypothetical protein